MRICSLLPSATEIVCSLGLIDDLVAVSHECDFPPEVKNKPVVTHSLIDGAQTLSAEIDAVVSQRLRAHLGLYHLDDELLARLEPDLILTQELCDVCAVSYEQVEAAARALDGRPSILSLEPTDLEGVFQSFRAVGRATRSEDKAEELMTEIRARISVVRRQSMMLATRPRVACLEWLDPPFVAGHWVPQMTGLAGGDDVLGEAGQPSRRLSWEEVLDAQPDVIVLMPCGFDTERTLREFRTALHPDSWQDVPAVRTRQVYAVDANAYFSRPGPRLARGIEILSEVFANQSSESAARLP